MNRLDLRRWLFRATLASGLVLALGLVYFALLDLLWLPSGRTIVAEVRCGAPCTLSVTPDIGRGFLGLDTLTRKLPAGNGTASLELPLTSSRVRIDSGDSANPARIRRVSEISAHGTLALKAWEDVANVWTLPLLSERVPLAGYISSALGALLLLLPVASARARTHVDEVAQKLSLALSRDHFATPRSLLLSGALLAVALVVTASAADAFHVLIRRIDNPPYWPISLFDPASFGVNESLGAILLAASAYFVFAGWSKAPRKSPARVILLGALALVLSNLLQGWLLGFVRPTAAEQGYFAESFAVQSASEYLRAYDESQASLGTHARTHPPGAVLLYYALRNAFADPGLLSLVLGLTAFALATDNVFHLARRFVGARAAALAALAFALLPAVQIYFIVSLEAVACACMTGALRFFLDERPAARWFGSTAYVLASLLLTFTSLFLIPVFFFYEFASKRSVRRSLGIFGLCAVLIGLLKPLGGFDWWQSLRVAAALENPDGFWLFESPGSYLFTRLEGIAEVLLFASPLVLLGLVTALRARFERARNLRFLVLAGLGSWVSMLLAGAFKTGETARSCLFVVPFLVLPLAALEDEKPLGAAERKLLTSAVFGQSVLMQLVGQYYW